MKGLLRRLRAMIGLGVAWAVVWTPIGIGMSVAQWLAGGFGLPPLELVATLVLSGVKNGFIAGFLFSGGLGLVCRNRTFDQLRPEVVCAIGAVAGTLLPAATMVSVAMAGYFVPPPIAIALALGFGGALGAATAIGSLKVAQAAPAELEASERDVGHLIDSEHRA